jgi:uncharacterized protein with HEPN domain
VSRDWLLYLDDLIASAEKIARLIAGRDLTAVRADEAAYDAVLFNLQIIGESVKRLPADRREALPEAHRAGPARLRDLIAHRYFAIEPTIIWDVVTHHVPALLEDARRLQREAGAADI